MEDYKKKYEEALDRARTFSQRWQGIEATDSELALQELKEIFPELKESEDERIKKGIIEYLEQSQFGEEHYQIDDDIVRNYIAWLENQVEQKSTWSEEDSAMLDNIVAWIEGKWGTLGGKVGGREAYTSFLKSLKERYAWKPSDEQMDALSNALGLAKSCGEESSYDLRTLYEQLKKLREE